MSRRPRTKKQDRLHSFAYFDTHDLLRLLLRRFAHRTEKQLQTTWSARSRSFLLGSQWGELAARGVALCGVN